MKRRKMVLILDRLDYDCIQTEIAKRQTHRWTNDDPLGGHVSSIDGVRREGPMLPDGDSNMVGAMLAECIRDLNDYRDLWNADHPPTKPAPTEPQP